MLEGIDLHEPGPEEVYVVSGIFMMVSVIIRREVSFTNPAGSSTYRIKAVALCLFLS